MSRPPIMSPTSRQMAMLRFIAGYAETHGGLMPSFKEMAEGTALRGKGAVHRTLGMLEDRGLIRRHRWSPRAIEILRYPSLPRGTDGVARYFVSVGGKNFHGGSNA